MTRLNDPRSFKEEMVDGYVAAYGRYVRRVPNASGVMAAGAPFPGRVAVINGGGSGHYPAFCGLVGEGGMTASVIGDIFTSPSGEHAYRVAIAVDGGAGILFTYGTYAGDVMNFDMAQARLRDEGIDCRTVLVSDDVLAAPPAESDKRRGIAGGFYVFKVAGASAARGDDLDTVEALARRANARVRTVGVAFAGCTFPGQSAPLFTVAPGQMEVGLGIHGEPGVRTSELLPAREIAALLVETILADAPADAGSRAAILVNGLGATQYEEMFVLFSGVAELLARAGIEPHEPMVGEFVTSLDMAGCSLTLFWLDDELQALHDATAITPAFTRIGPDVAGFGRRQSTHAATTTVATPSVAVDRRQPSDEGGIAGLFGATTRAALAAALGAIEGAEEELGRLDAAVGDGDHGVGMVRGFRAANDAVARYTGTARHSLLRAGTAFTDTAGGASGALVGGWLSALGAALPRDDEAIDAAAIAAALAAGLAAIQRLGQAEPGDKTMVDTLIPFQFAFDEAVAGGTTLADAWNRALPAAEVGMIATRDLVSRRGRASRLGERSRGHQDAGATSIYYVLRAMGTVWQGH